MFTVPNPGGCSIQRMDLSVYTDDAAVATFFFFTFLPLNQEHGVNS